MNAPTGQTGSGAADPAAAALRSLRGIGAGLLTLEAIVEALGIPVVAHNGRAAPAAELAAIGVVAALLFAGGFVIFRRRGWVYVTALQAAALVLAGLAAWSLLFIVAIFAGLWGGWLAMQRSLLARLAPASAEAIGPRTPLRRTGARPH